MSRNLKLNLVLIGCIAVSLIISEKLHYYRFGMFCCGSAVTLMAFNFIIDSIIKSRNKKNDRFSPIEEDHENLTADD